MKLSEGLNIQGSEIKNIIFDWGGVITDLHPELTINAFRAMGFKHFDEAFSQDENQNLFLQFEMGKIDESAFINELKRQLDSHVTDKQVLDAWNALLGDLPAERWMLLKNLANDYRIFLLSNTNSLHITYYFSKLEQLYGIYGYNHLFEKVYFSHHLGMRKPNRNIYEFVMKDSALLPEETLFIDDNPDNIDTARQLGITAYHLLPPLTLTDLFE
ncbi:MAG: HAD family phosphatase [Bacteroidales bacterium]|nr:HAD family phosphatase [Bacteroidales bacterium]MBN2763087.1 HAD family phosphatase [Bacteroidales bacterium]